MNSFEDEFGIPRSGAVETDLMKVTEMEIESSNFNFLGVPSL